MKIAIQLFLFGSKCSFQRL